MDIDAWCKEIRRARFDAADHRNDILDLTWIAGEREQRRKSTLGIRLKEVGQKHHAVSNHDLDIVRAPDVEFHLAQRQIIAPVVCTPFSCRRPGSTPDALISISGLPLAFRTRPRLLYCLSHRFKQTIMSRIEKRRPDAAFATTNSSFRGKAACAVRCRPGCVRLKLYTGPY